jgi:hypothetical protein
MIRMARQRDRNVLPLRILPERSCLEESCSRKRNACMPQVREPDGQIGPDLSYVAFMRQPEYI